MPKSQGPSLEPALPEAVFHAIAYLLPGLNQVAQECGITIGEWIIMWHISQAGRHNETARPTMLRQDLTEVLGKRGFGDANITRLLNNLEDKQFVRRMSLTHQERDKLFGVSDGGNRMAVVLQTSGDEKILQFKQQLAAHFGAWRSEQSVMIQKALESTNGVALQFMEWFFKGKQL